MKRVLLALLFWSVLLQVLARADGYSFDSETQRLSVPSLRLKLDEAQVKEISAFGTLKFSEEQMRLLRLFYPSATEHANVVVATHNDNREDVAPDEVNCFWVAPDEVAVELNEKLPKDKSPFPAPVNAVFPSEANLKSDPERHIRLSPTGNIYFRGELIALERAFGLIDELARFPKTSLGIAFPEPGACLYVTMPPPLSSHEASYLDETQRQPKQLLETLKAYGRSKVVGVEQRW
ncbi:hypothetical protein [Roseimicrobium sp. ORNL1]|uniref:hypothetical protein n=1 Tax=Roseimicrobium sp. ORNL1 TaxID=2711231 RepID=UPI0013E1E5AE|nr:hypothetical protein [Roseimicrobium sp. ORNL1]QIF05259.1 hypothetical protein G5S37_28365 [Roseimicrobium sp. ORNL1]